MQPPLPRLSTILALLLCSSALAAQERASNSFETPLLAEWGIGPAIVGGGRWVQSSGGIQLGLLWTGCQQESGLRLGLSASRADIKEPLPPSPTEGGIRARNAGVFFIERTQIRRPGPWVVITGYGFGAGSLGYEFDNTRNDSASKSPPVESWAPALTVSAEVAWRTPIRSALIHARPLDLVLNVRSTALLGVRRVGDDVPGSGEVPSTRELGHVQHLSIGMRVGLLSDWFR